MHATSLVRPQIHNGVNLKNADVGGKSDPYCILKGFNGRVTGGNHKGGKEGKTAVVSNDLNPSWEETHVFLIGDEVTSCVCKVLDEDVTVDCTMSAFNVHIGVPEIPEGQQTEYRCGRHEEGSVYITHKTLRIADVASYIPFLSTLGNGNMPPVADSVNIQTSLGNANLYVVVCVCVCECVTCTLVARVPVPPP